MPTKMSNWKDFAAVNASDSILLRVFYSLVHGVRFWNVLTLQETKLFFYKKVIKSLIWGLIIAFH